MKGMMHHSGGMVKTRGFPDNPGHKPIGSLGGKSVSNRHVASATPGKVGPQSGSPADAPNSKGVSIGHMTQKVK